MTETVAEPFVMVEQVIIVLLAGIIGAKLSERFGLPMIIPLFISGYIIGPEGLGIFVPLELGLSLSVIVTLAIPVILFDEGMRIDLKLLNEFKSQIVDLSLDNTRCCNLHCRPRISSAFDI